MLRITARPAKRPAPRARRMADESRTRLSPSEPLPPVDVGQRLRALRTARKLSLRALAEQSGLNINTLSLIENGKTSPSVSTLQQLAQALRVSIVAFFEMETPKLHIVHTHAEQRPTGLLAHGTLADLGAGLADRPVEPFVLTLGPNMGSGLQPIVHTGHEFVFCLTGRLLYTIEDQTFLLAEGDSLLFEAHLPHRWQNAALEATQALLVLCPADARDEPAVLHVAPASASIKPTRPQER